MDRDVLKGAIIGDIAGSIYEWDNIKYKIKPEFLVSYGCRFTDDTVMTCSSIEGLINALIRLPNDWMAFDHEAIFKEELITSMKQLGRRYINAGYGGRFHRWLTTPEDQPYYSYGNGAAMRVSFAGWAGRTLKEAMRLGELTAMITHDHPESLKASKVIAGMIYLLRYEGKEKAVAFAREYYDLDFTLDEIRDTYRFDVSCQGSVPQAIKAFIEGENYADVISGAISIGGDSDTIAAIAGSLAEACYPIEDELWRRAYRLLPQDLIAAIDKGNRYLRHQKAL